MSVVDDVQARLDQLKTLKARRRRAKELHRQILRGGEWMSAAETVEWVALKLNISARLASDTVREALRSGELVGHVELGGRMRPIPARAFRPQEH